MRFESCDLAEKLPRVYCRNGDSWEESRIVMPPAAQSWFDDVSRTRFPAGKRGAKRVLTEYLRGENKGKCRACSNLLMKYRFPIYPTRM